MFKKIKTKLASQKDYHESKESLELILMDRISLLIQKEIENQELQHEILAAAKEQNAAFTPEETRAFMEQLAGFIEKMEQTKA